MLKIDLNGYAKAASPVSVDVPPSPEKTYSPGADCSSCQARGTWDIAEFKGKAVCFHRAYFLGKAGNPVICDVARRACPLNNQGQEIRK